MSQSTPLQNTPMVPQSSFRKIKTSGNGCLVGTTSALGASSNSGVQFEDIEATGHAGVIGIHTDKVVEHWASQQAQNRGDVSIPVHGIQSSQLFHRGTNTLVLAADEHQNLGDHYETGSCSLNSSYPSQMSDYPSQMSDYQASESQATESTESTALTTPEYLEPL